jgi:hypothetical protein
VPKRSLLIDLGDYSGITSPWVTVDALTSQISDWGNYSVTVEGENSVKVWDHDNARHVILETPLHPFYFFRFRDDALEIDWQSNA